VRDPKANSEDDAHVITRTTWRARSIRALRALGRMRWLATTGLSRGMEDDSGAFPADVLEDNTNAWSGDHCMDFTKVPGVLLSNRKIDAQTPALTDIAPRFWRSSGLRRRRDERAIGFSAALNAAGAI